jgi:hypothetical protein
MRSYHHRLYRTLIRAIRRGATSKHPEPDAREAEDQASDQFDHTGTINTPDGRLRTPRRAEAGTTNSVEPHDVLERASRAILLRVASFEVARARRYSRARSMCTTARRRHDRSGGLFE